MVPTCSNEMASFIFIKSKSTKSPRPFVLTRWDWWMGRYWC